MDEILDLTPGLQCCLRCGRVLTDRALHDALEEPVLASLRANHPELAGNAEECRPCLEEYRGLLGSRLARVAAQPRGPETRREPFRMAKWIESRLAAGRM